MCRFSDLSIGDEITFTAHNCNYCNEWLGLEMNAVYAGHITHDVVYDVIRITPFRCPSCGELLTSAYFECDTGPEIDTEIFKRKVEYVE